MFPIFFLLQIGSNQALYRGPGREAASGLRFFRSVAAAGPFATVDAQRIQRTADDLVADSGQIANASSADEDDGVFLKAVTLARNVDRDFLAVGESHPRDFAKGRVRLLGCHRPDLQTDPAFLGAFVEHRGLRLGSFGAAFPADELINCGHMQPSGGLGRGTFLEFLATTVPWGNGFLIGGPCFPPDVRRPPRADENM